MTDKETEDLQKYLGRMIAEQSRLQRALIDGEPLDDEAPPDLSGLLFPDPLRSTLEQLRSNRLTLDEVLAAKALHDKIVELFAGLLKAFEQCSSSESGGTCSTGESCRAPAWRDIPFRQAAIFLILVITFVLAFAAPTLVRRRKAEVAAANAPTALTAPSPQGTP